MRNICYIRFGPTSKILGERLDPWWFHQNGFNVLFWEIAKIYYNESNINKYFFTPSYKFIGPNHEEFENKEKFIQSLKKLSKDTIIVYGNRSPFLIQNDVWLTDFITNYFKIIIPIQFDTRPLSKNFFIFLKDSLGLLKHRYYSKKLNFSHFIGCGKVGKLNAKIIHPKAEFISIPSPIILWESSNKILEESYNVFVDENIIYHPDGKIYNVKKATYDYVTYYKNLNYFLKLIEDFSSKPTIIAASIKYIYKKDFFEGRKIIYGKTLELIQHSDLVLGHCSLALYQAIINNKPIIQFNVSDFTENKKAHNKYTARMTNKKIYESSNFTKKDYNNSLRVDSLKNQIIEKNYFREFNSYQDYRTIIKKKLGNL